MLAELRAQHGGYELLFHHTRGEFHHDVGGRAVSATHLPAPVLVIATNCNGGVKELPAFDAEPTPAALWHWRCPESAGVLARVGRARERAQRADGTDRSGRADLSAVFESPEFAGSLPTLRAESRTHHGFEPCELLEDSARSELRPEWRERQPGGGWRMRSCAAPARSDDEGG